MGRPQYGTTEKAKVETIVSGQPLRRAADWATGLASLGLDSAVMESLMTHNEAVPRTLRRSGSQFRPIGVEATLVGMKEHIDIVDWAAEHLLGLEY